MLTEKTTQKLTARVSGLLARGLAGVDVEAMAKNLAPQVNACIRRDILLGIAAAALLQAQAIESEADAAEAEFEEMTAQLGKELAARVAAR